MSYNDQEYKKLADAIVADLVMNKVPLTDSVVKLAGDLKMNAHETRRLLEHTNMEAHLAFYGKMAEHKYVDFDVVDPEAVCDRLFASPDPRESPDDAFGKMASLSLELPDERWDLLSHAAAEKLASEVFPAAVPEPEPDRYAGTKFAEALHLASRVGEELEMKARAAHMRYTDKVAELTNAFSYVSAMPFPEFEQDAHAIATPKIASVILYKMREMNPRFPAAEQTKTASTATRYVVERNEHSLLREVVAAYSEALELAQACQWYDQNAGPLLQ